MRKVGGAPARALDLAFLRVEQRVDLLDQWLHLDRRGRRQMIAATGADVGDAAAQRAQGLQAEADLDGGGDRQHQAQNTQRQSEVARERAGRRRHAREIGGDRDPHRHALAGDGQADHAFRHQHLGMRGPGHDMMMDFSRRRLVGFQRQRGVP